jgi:peptidoglycan/LPS O-acetylase OafA/YrhL
MNRSPLSAEQKSDARRPTYEAYRAVKTFSGLDGLRCLSILAVVWLHAGESPWLQRVFPASGYGFLGVDLFFTISGFLIVTLLLRQRARAGEISLASFYYRRALRILPIYYGLVLTFAVIYFFVRPESDNAAAFRGDFLPLLFFLTNWLPASGMLAITWSLAAEEQFYLLWPPIEKWLSKYTALFLVVALGVSQTIHFGLADPLLERAFGWTADEPAMLRETTFTPILFGVVLAHTLHDRRGYDLVANVLGRRFSALGCLLALIALCNVLPADIRGWGRLAVHVTMVALVASVVVREDSSLRRFLTFPPVVRVGVLSYGIYLFHHVALGVVHKGLGDVPHAVLFAAGMLVVVIAAELSFRFYETPFLRLKDRAWGRVPEKPPAAEPTAAPDR